MKFTSARQQLSCLLCRWHRTYLTASRPHPRGGAQRIVQRPLSSRPSPGSRPALSLYQTPIQVPRPDGPQGQASELRVLPRPIGMHDPPMPSHLTGPVARATEQKKDANSSIYAKNLQRRSELISQWKRPYFRDFQKLRLHEGKTFLAPLSLFKGDLSLYFPNFAGRTLMKGDRKLYDTTPVLRGRTSVVCVFSSQWADSQVQSYISESNNPAFHKVFTHCQQYDTQSQSSEKHGLSAPQIVRINVEENPVKAWLVRLFMGAVRRQMAKQDWGRYFLVTQGLSDEIRESIGFLNSKVGHIYLVDDHCRIRWAACGPSTPEERDALAKGVRRLVERKATSLGMRAPDDINESVQA